ncbi:MAG: hypothetical protein A3H97_13060 [Acidobacteria bacterium RIFCSPLOWO2_02_FULL_65_29]|nr:MAG: hypothetical protein A3H97_13060 [Acidobacteria bacterium RIFCSPLOWO2_02_FULL_65_29]
MATVTVYRAGNMLNPVIWYGTLTSYSSSHITISAYPYVGTYYGSFTFTPTSLAGGTATGYTQSYLGSLDYTVTGVNADALTVYNYVQSGDAVGVQQYVLQYNDIIQGSAFADALRGWNGNDTIIGGGGSDTLLGDPGNDVAYGEAGNDVLQGGTGDDILYGGTGSDSLYGEDGNDWLFGGEDNDTLFGGQGNDALIGGAGNDILDGGTGIDIAFLDGNRVDNTVGAAGTNVVGPDGTDMLSNIERLKFSDKSLALDMGVSEAGGKTALLLGACLGANGLSNKAIVGAMLGYFDGGYTLTDAATALVDAGIVAQLAGGADNKHFVDWMYLNVVDALPDASTEAVLIDFITSGQFTQGTFLATVAALPLNQDHIGLVGLQDNGMEFF